MAFPTGIPHELAIGDRMHDDEFPGDRGYRFEERSNMAGELRPRLYKGKPVEIPLEKVLRDAKGCGITTEPSVDLSYKHFVAFFKDAGEITPHEVVIGASFTYSWMPTTLTLRHEDQLENVAAYLEAVRHGNDLDRESLSLINSVVNNSMIGTSKLLHFVNPGRYVIYDKWVDTYLYGKPSDAHLYSVEHYMSFTCGCRRSVEDKRFKAVHQHVNASLGYDVSALRALELVMFLTAKERSET
jgi:hypothetical protein